MKLGSFDILLSNHQALGSRERQEDYFAFHFEESQPGIVNSAMLVLTDGMGGYEGGDAASVVAVNTFVATMRDMDDATSLTDRLRIATQEANAAVFNNSQSGEMGSTLVAFYLDHQMRQWISVGDSIIFRVNDMGIERLNHDHNMGARIDRELSEGLITQDEADWKFPDRKLLTSSLGSEVLDEMEISDPEPITPGETYILASDGLTDALPINEMLQVVFRSQPDSICRNLVDEAISRNFPNQDNVSAISVSIVAPIKNRIQNVLRQVMT